MSQVIVSKFGGSSMKDAEAMLRSASITCKQKSNIVLVSATYKTTDNLLRLIDEAIKKPWNFSEKNLFILKERHFDILENLNKDPETFESLKKLLNELGTLIHGVHLLKECSPKAYDNILSFGERVSSLLFTEAMRVTSKNKNILYFDTREVLKTNSNFKNAKVNLTKTKQACESFFQLKENTFYIGQGFIGSDLKGSTTTLGRGGSDYSAAILAEAVEADVLEIWTDVAGIATTDPRVCDSAKPIHEISYDEASEMAQYGAKILHPTTLLPAMRQKIPVFVGSSYAAEQKGTWIKESAGNTPLIRAITKRSDQALLTIKTPKMLDAFGFMGKIFDTFTKHQVSVDCVTTSEINVAISTNVQTLENEDLLDDLREIGEVETETGFSLISLIGNQMLETSGLASRVFTTINDINIRMLCLGASAYNFNILISESQANQAVVDLHQEFIQ